MDLILIRTEYQMAAFLIFVVLRNTNFPLSSDLCHGSTLANKLLL